MPYVVLMRDLSSTLNGGRDTADGKSADVIGVTLQPKPAYSIMATAKSYHEHAPSLAK